MSQRQHLSYRQPCGTAAQETKAGNFLLAAALAGAIALTLKRSWKRDPHPARRFIDETAQEVTDAVGRAAGEAQHAVNTAIRDAARAAEGAVRGSARALRRVRCRLRISL